MPTRRAFLRWLTASTLAASTLAASCLAASPLSAAAEPAEFVGIDGWINAASPLTLAGLRGKVVLVDFWTYSCINCRRTVRYLNRFQAQYGAQGLQVIGIHTPEFGFERVRHNVFDAVQEFGIRYPVGQDNGFHTWRAWDNRAWPSFYLLDRSGRITLVREGEGHAHELEAAIRALLGLDPDVVPVPGDDTDLFQIRTAEFYFGAIHPTPQDRTQQPRLGEATYRWPPDDPAPGRYQLDGTWLRQDEVLVLRSARGAVRARFSAAKFHLVAAAPRAATLQVTVDGAASQAVTVERPTLYTLFDSGSYHEHIIALETDTPGLCLFSATFG